LGTSALIVLIVNAKDNRNALAGPTVEVEAVGVDELKSLALPNVHYS
jgi:hypothetical protein